MHKRRNSSALAMELHLSCTNPWIYTTKVLLFMRSAPEGLTHCGRETHICIGKLTIIASDNGLSPGWRQAIFWTNAGILLIGPLGTNFNEILIKIHIFSFKKMHLKMLCAKWRPFCINPNVLSECYNMVYCTMWAWPMMENIHQIQLPV